MRLITVALFVIQLGWAEVYAGDSPNGQERFLQLVAEAKGQKPGAVEALEEFFNVTSDKVLAVQSAALLALYSHSKLKKRPEVYAEYALLHESSPVVDRASLYRIAGDGHFAHGQFDKAQSLYSRALDDPSVPSDSKEYFSYKMAWSFLNLHQTRRAFNEFHRWLLSHPEGQLREPMLIDFGRSFGETRFSKDRPPENERVTLPSFLSESEKPKFLEGVFQSLVRLKISDTTPVYKALMAEGWRASALAYIVSTERFEMSAPCEVMEWIEVTGPSDWPLESAVAALKKCAAFALSQEKARPENLEHLAVWLEKFPLKAFEQTIAGKLYFQAANKKEACRSALSTIDRLEAADQTWLPTWWADGVESCFGTSGLKELLAKIPLLDPSWLNFSSREILLTLKTIPFETKSLLFGTWVKERDYKEQATVHLRAMIEIYEAEKTHALMGLVCPVDAVSISEECLELWMSWSEGAAVVEPVLAERLIELSLQAKPQKYLRHGVALGIQNKLLKPLVENMDKLASVFAQDSQMLEDFSVQVLDTRIMGSTRLTSDFEVLGWLKSCDQLLEGDSERAYSCRGFPEGLKGSQLLRDAEIYFGIWRAGRKTDIASISTESQMVAGVQDFLEIASSFQSARWRSERFKEESNEVLAQMAQEWVGRIDALGMAVNNSEWNSVRRSLKQWSAK